ncbi:hypothetical protein GCM10022226_59920 [Sphaerisporangium flaviroseum]|uniref:Uncharacterized protein n=1 Tax=Sphaerisporangium flaviroseum TaxID=509199 RepID=A0ABP7IZM4_9ACTN
MSLPWDERHRPVVRTGHFATGGSRALQYAKDGLAGAEGALVVRPGAALTRVTAAEAREVSS